MNNLGTFIVSPFNGSGQLNIQNEFVQIIFFDDNPYYKHVLLILLNGDDTAHSKKINFDELSETDQSKMIAYVDYADEVNELQSK
jgi:hypothetical protein